MGKEMEGTVEKGKGKLRRAFKHCCKTSQLEQHHMEPALQTPDAMAVGRPSEFRTVESLKRRREEAFGRKSDNCIVIRDTLARCDVLRMEGRLRRPRHGHVCLLLGAQPRGDDIRSLDPVHVSVTVDDCVDVAARLGRQRGTKIWLLNMANASMPGGGVLGGANAQEEHLCWCSDLLPNPEATRARGKDYVELPEVDWTHIGVLTAAAERMVPCHCRRAGPDAARRIGFLLDMAAMQDCTHLVLSAWGCGAFHQDATLVAMLFREALSRRHRQRFPRVVFAVKDDHNSQSPGNAAVFRTVLVARA